MRIPESPSPPRKHVAPGEREQNAVQAAPVRLGELRASQSCICPLPQSEDLRTCWPSPGEDGPLTSSPLPKSSLCGSVGTSPARRLKGILCRHFTCRLHRLPQVAGGWGVSGGKTVIPLLYAHFTWLHPGLEDTPKSNTGGQGEGASPLASPPSSRRPLPRQCPPNR